MSTFLQSLQTQFDALPVHPVLHTQRARALQTALANGLPTQRMERWKYTSLRALGNRQFINDANTDMSSIDVSGIPAPRALFVDGKLQKSLSDFSGLPIESLNDVLQSGHERDYFFLKREFSRGDETFAQLNTALATDGLIIRIAENTRIPETLHLVFISIGNEQATHTRHLIELGAGSQLSVVEHHYSIGDATGLSNHIWHVHVGREAQLQHLRIQNNAPSQTEIGRYDAALASHAVYERHDLNLGNHLLRLELNIDLQGDNARFVSNGAILGDGKRHMDVRLAVEHIAQHTESQINWKSIGKERSHVAFHGGIHIRAGADHTAAHLSNKNLLLSDNAEIDTQPLMEIHADEVTASHGATIGQLDDRALFYLRSRGIPADAARELLMQAFLREPFAHTNADWYAQWIEPALNQRLQGAL